MQILIVAYVFLQAFNFTCKTLKNARIIIIYTREFKTVKIMLFVIIYWLLLQLGRAQVVYLGGGGSMFMPPPPRYFFNENVHVKDYTLKDKSRFRKNLKS